MNLFVFNKNVCFFVEDVSDASLLKQEQQVARWSGANPGQPIDSPGLWFRSNPGSEVAKLANGVEVRSAFIHQY